APAAPLSPAGQQRRHDHLQATARLFHAESLLLLRDGLLQFPRAILPPFIHGDVANLGPYAALLETIRDQARQAHDRDFPHHLWQHGADELGGNLVSLDALQKTLAARPLWSNTSWPATGSSSW